MIKCIATSTLEYINQLYDSIPQHLIKNSIIIALFLCGILLGFGILWAIYYIETKRKPKLNKQNKVFDVTDEEILSDVINPACDNFIQNYGSNEIGEKFEGIKKATIFLIMQISKKYYPKSSYPILEVSSDQLLKLINKVSDKICRTLEKFLNENFVYKNVYKAGIFLHNVSKKEKVSYQWKELKLSTIKEIIEGTQNQQSNNFFDKVGATVLSMSSKLLNSFINTKITELIQSIGQEVSKVYGRKQITPASLLNEEIENKEAP